ncbi:MULTISPECIES: DUF362 domain-containing protein [Clostridia]|uniref:DUF362 domain-containing protein n=1 Tax=Clostridia TaxID=186801 RepID=UPI00067F5D41|nr:MULTISPECIES: DUF362 domain-containing protein [Clostridia]
MELVYIFEEPEYGKDKIKKLISLSKVLESINTTDTVVVKPNFVQESRVQDDDWDYVITHPVIISAVLELLCEILDQDGRIILADAPMTGASFDKILSHLPVEEWKQYCGVKKIPFEIIDLRDEEWEMASNGIILNRQKLSGDPLGKVLANLQRENSEFFYKSATTQKLYGADYNIKETNNAHNGVDNYYSVSKTVISADVFINLPKLKTHKKAGITCCLKNLVGINTNKNLLPHHTIGTPKDGGDQFESSSSSASIESGITMAAKNMVVKFKILSPLLIPLKKIAVLFWGDNKKTARSGGWFGNDTLWRTILDLNKVMFYANSDGTFREDKCLSKKKYIGIVDGIYAGQGNGPLEPDLIKAGLLICGTNPVAIDCVAAKLMHFDYKKIPQLYHAFDINKYRLIESTYEEIECVYRNKKQKLLDLESSDLFWKAALGWIGHIEL